LVLKIGCEKEKKENRGEVGGKGGRLPFSPSAIFLLASTLYFYILFFFPSLD